MEENIPELTVLGCSDAFCSGGRRQTAFLLHRKGANTLIDCGATTLLGLKQNKISFDTIDCIVLSHFHGDHYGGIPFLILEAAVVQKRKKPLTILSPPGLEAKLEQLFECLYPGSTNALKAFPIHYRSYKEGEELHHQSLSVCAYPVKHAPKSQPHGLRIQVEGKILAFSGDTGWHENLVTIAQGADLFICECNFYKQESPHHLNYQQFLGKENELKARRTVLTHLGEEMLAHRGEIRHEVLEQDQSYSF